MYKKSLILFLTIVCFNTSFGDVNVTAIEAELFKKLENVDPAQAVPYLTLQQELNQNNRHESLSPSKPGMFLVTTCLCAAGGIIAAFGLNGEPQKAVGVFAALGFVGSLAGIGCTEKTTPYSDKNSEILAKMNVINLTPIKK